MFDTTITFVDDETGVTANVNYKTEQPPMLNGNCVIFVVSERVSEVIPLHRIFKMVTINETQA